MFQLPLMTLNIFKNPFNWINHKSKSSICAPIAEINLNRLGVRNSSTLARVSISYMEVINISVNLAFKRPTEQSGIFFKSKAKFSVDHNLNTCAVIRSFGTEFAWWRVILDGSYYITNVNIYFAANLTG